MHISLICFIFVVYQNKTIMKVVFNFGGFYHSDFSDLIDDIVYDEDESYDTDNIDFQALHVEVSKSIVETFNDYIKSEYDTDIKLKFVELNSPRSYNYTTDKIIVKITKEDRIKLDLLVANDEDVESILKDVVSYETTSRPGYMPYYNYDEVIAKVNKKNRDVYYECLLDALFVKEDIFEQGQEDIRNTVYSSI